MSDFKTFLDRLSARIANRGYREEVRDEILDHLECVVAELVAEGIAEDEARRQAMQRLGDPNVIGTVLNDSARGGGRMRAVVKWGTVVIVAAVLLTFGSAWAFLRINDAVWVAATNRFTQRLAAQGVTIQETDRSKWASFFPGSQNRAAFVKTDLGVLHVVFFSGAKDAEEIRLTPLHSEDGRHRYLVEINQWSRVIDSNAPELFTLRGNLFVITREPALHEAVQRALQN